MCAYRSGARQGGESRCSRWDQEKTEKRKEASDNSDGFNYVFTLVRVEDNCVRCCTGCHRLAVTDWLPRFSEGSPKQPGRAAPGRTLLHSYFTERVFRCQCEAASVVYSPALNGPLHCRNRLMAWAAVVCFLMGR